MTIQAADISRDHSTVQARTGCRLCGKLLRHSFVDLGMSPPCESFVTAERLDHMEPYYPLHAQVCDHCFLVQLKEYFSPADICTEYAYFSSFATSWVSHAKNYCDEITERLELNDNSFVVEIASNDGYLLQHFLPKNIPILGIEPAANVARTAIAKGVPTLVDFFGSRLALEMIGEGRKADLIIGNNVLAQVPDLNDFVRGMQLLLKPEGLLRWNSRISSI
ncbi:possible s-adenosylmethionine-dependent methyltransferase [Brucella melitensis bv. 1 str. 16M]|uniref:Possible s-adenosylmethionine-dependent methyltransferase n=1 Tax=Brucella melitensis biotype 1 (strain ATCC 23456 / CCUG 17765 / NCTC 10094 / 16M) TaxID=224914 RepID=Q8YBQ9_BRUME|nr:possible s-adenosylmethionine-dependent methyltransferase [Brucella melitensis bv. 1 str. 16M]